MKRPAYTIQIEDPCNEDWSKMESTGTGKFCGHCQHSVIDFTRLTDSQVIALIEKTEGKICGRFNNHQLNRIMQETGPTQNPALYKILAAMLLVSTASTAMAETPKDTAMAMPLVTMRNDTALAPATKPTHIIITGQVSDINTLEPIAFANIVLLNNGVSTGKGVCTDLDGKFMLTVPAFYISDSSSIQASFVGYNKSIIKLSSRLSDSASLVLLPIYLDDYMIEVTMGCMVVIYEEKTNIIPSIDYNISDDLMPDTTPQPFIPKKDVP